MKAVLVHVDDDSQLPEGVTAPLEAEGYRWLRTADPEMAMRAVEGQQAALVLMELDLAACDGPDLMAGIRSVRGGEVPVLVLTRLSRDSGMLGEAIAAGVSDFLTKPVLASQLLASIREILPPPSAPTPVAAPAPDATPASDLAGEIGDTSVAELLARLRRRGASGVLKLHRRRAYIGVQLRNGSPISVGSNRRVGGSGVTPEDRAEATLLATFGWEDGAWEFFSGQQLSPDASDELSCDPAELLMRGVIEESSLEQVRERLRKRATLYVSVVDPSEEPLDGLELTSRQEAILEEMAGQDSLGDLLASNAFEEHLLYALWVAGRIELHAVPTLDLTDLLGEDPAPPTAPRPEPARASAPARSSRRAKTRRPKPVVEARPAPAIEPPPAPVIEPPPAPEIEPRPAPEIEPRPTPAIQPPPAPVVEPRQKPVTEVRRTPPTETLETPAIETREELSQTLRELAQQVMGGDDFDALGVGVDVSDEALREAHQQQLRRIPRSALDSADVDLRARAVRIQERLEAAYAHLNDPESRRAYALLRKEEDQDRDAKRTAERALEGERWFRKGKGHLDHRRHDEAAEAFGMASHLDPNEGEYLSHLGYALFLSKPGDKVVQRESMEHIANGIKRSPTSEISYVYLGRVLKARGEEQAALKLFRRALRIKPEFHPALQELRLLEMRSRKGKGILSRILGS